MDYIGGYEPEYWANGNELKNSQAQDLSECTVVGVRAR